MDRTAFEDELRRVRAAFGNDTFAGVGLQARAASLEQAVDCALVAPTTAPVTAADLLSRRERDVVLLVARGLSNRQIADELIIGERTVETHVSNALRKLDLP